MQKQAFVAFVALLCACASAPPATGPTTTTTTTTAGARSAADLALDAGRKPELFLAFAGVRPGQRIADLGAGGGYTTDLLARAVGETGRVYGHNSKWVLERFAEKPWSERLRKPEMNNVVRVDREFDDPLPPEASDLDVVVDVLFYHDTVWLGTDRQRMNRAVFDHLKPGGLYIVIDHSAKPGAGLNDVQTLHRIEEGVVRAEVEAAGFVFVEDSNAWRNADDARDWNDAPGAAKERRGTSDRFALKFKKP